jgi:hypothetical protein
MDRMSWKTSNAMQAPSIETLNILLVKVQFILPVMAFENDRESIVGD